MENYTWEDFFWSINISMDIKFMKIIFSQSIIKQGIMGISFISNLIGIY